MSGLTVKNGSSPVVSTTVTYVNPSSSATSTQVKTWNNGKAAYTYTYDNKGNITSISDGSKTVTYAYDAFGRLVDVYDPVAKQHCVYTYDDGGNLLQQVIYKPKQSSGGGGGDIVIPVDPPVEPPIEVIVAAAPDDYGYYLSATVNYTYGDANWPDLLTAFNGKSITYDAIGNPLSDGTWTYAWQHGRQLASMSKSGSSITYGYNADGKRISKTVNGTTYNFSYLGDQLTEMTWGSNKLHFTYDSTGPASVTYNGNRYFYLKNAQGDVTGLVNASGTQVVSYTYDPWGAPMSVSGSMSATLGAVNPLRYRGYVYDSETGLYYLSSRYYNPVWGRFINADGYASTGQGFTGDNMFAYCNDNPVNRSDSNGNFSVNVIGALVGGAVALGMDMLNYAFSGQPIDWGQVAIDVAFGALSGFFLSAENPLLDAAISLLNNTVNEVYAQAKSGFQDFNLKSFARTVALNTAQDIVVGQIISRKADDALAPIKVTREVASGSAAGYAAKANARRQAGRSSSYYAKRAATQNRNAEYYNKIYYGLKAGISGFWNAFI